MLTVCDVLSLKTFILKKKKKIKNVLREASVFKIAVLKYGLRDSFR